MSKKQFQMVCALWITPDFTDVMAGRAEPPRVNHSAVDFAALHGAMSELFPYGPPVQIQLPNDTIDQVSVHVREAGKRGVSIRCEDFGAALLHSAKHNDKQIIDVSAAWAPLHALADRAFAPPPVILPFVVTATDFEDAMIWLASTRPCLRLPMVDPANPELYAGQEAKQNGTLPPVFLQQLRTIFGTPFEPMCVLDRMCMDKPPQGYGLV
ncbi:hypothetical protein [Paraburkholderia domus]|uniref:hypothetical protein n=1 Tax=Paraburkholderia domus TaxID=2793075 RepID=UPI0019147E37|nr:hypothetical protein [Paraburkholderia domus]MBK5066353.1 hypothetical protein [Burkholderia sp. R-70199]CAE6969577.1 hypothetical protein R70199_08087 [Paraburkholderia domus]